MIYRYEREPHPHLIVEQTVAPDVYKAMLFPDELVATNSAWGMTRSDPAYAEAMSDPAWASLHEELTSEAFVRGVLVSFADDMRAAGCLVDPHAAWVGSFVESREDKELAVLDPGADPNELFTRVDFQSKSFAEYRDFVHLDWPRRVVGAILFFSDADEEGLEGGELAFYRDRGFRNDRWCHEPELTAMFRPRHNTGVIFLNSNEGFHGPRRVVALRGRRRWLYYTISSKADVWPAAKRPTSVGAAGRSLAT
jgi:hypothetical protein